jgi:hypothetical protein
VVGIAGPDSVQDQDLTADQCRGYLYDSTARPQETPGTYYWQAFRICTGCPGGYESGPVQSFTLTLAGSSVGLTLKAPGQVYRGYAAVAMLTTTGLATGQPVSVQGRSAGGWKTVGRGTVTADQAVVPFKAPKGTTSLRAVYAASATEVVASAERSVKVLEPKKWPKAKTWAGKWKGSVSVSSQDDSTASFKVAGNPSVLRKGTFRLTLLCPNPVGPSPTTIQIADAIVPRAPVAPDGSFVATVADSQHAILLYGRLLGRKATGTVTMSLGTCSGSGTLKAHHT